MIPLQAKGRSRALKRTLIAVILLTLGMFGFGFALVPMYNVLCKATGLNGKTGGAVAYNPHPYIDTNRMVTVEFVATNNAYLPWEFYPLIKKVRMHPGENVQLAFYARNNANQTMTVQAIPSVAPGLAAKYLKKTECFCFTQQTFKAKEAHDMPLLFHIDPDLPGEINTITLSYTLFDAARYKPAEKRLVGHIQ